MEAVYPEVKQKLLLDDNLEGLLPLIQLQGGGAQ
jgi:hypothetical protein